MWSLDQPAQRKAAQQRGLVNQQSIAGVSCDCNFAYRCALLLFIIFGGFDEITSWKLSADWIKWTDNESQNLHLCSLNSSETVAPQDRRRMLSVGRGGQSEDRLFLPSHDLWYLMIACYPPASGAHVQSNRSHKGIESTRNLKISARLPTSSFKT